MITGKRANAYRLWVRTPSLEFYRSTNKKTIYKIMNYILYRQPISKTKHIFRIMKITVVALFASVFSIYATEASSQNAKVSIHANQLSTKELIAEIEKQTDYLFVYNRNEVDVTRLVSLNVRNESVSDVLNKIFAETRGRG